FRPNRDCSGATLKNSLGIDNPKEAAPIWAELQDAFGAELPANLFREIFESRRLPMISAHQWPADKPLPDPEQFLTRNLLESTLKDMNYVPTKLEVGTKTN